MLSGPIASGGVDSGVNAAASNGVALVANASNHAKATSFTTLIASLSRDVDWWIINVCPDTNVSFLIDIAVGASSSEQVIIANLPCSTGGTTAEHGHQFLIPLAVKAGERISARCQASTGSSQCFISVNPLSATLLGQGFCGLNETLGADTTNTRGTEVDPGGSSNTDGSYVTVGTTTFAWKWCSAAFLFREAPASASDASWLVDLAVGASNLILVPDLLVNTSTGADDSFATYSFPVAVASGQAVKARARCSITNATDRIIDIILYGSG